MALALASLAILTMIGVFTSGLRLLGSGRELAVSTGLGRELMEQMKLQPYGEIVPGVYDGRVPTPPAGAFPPAPYPVTQINGMDYTFRVVVTSPGPSLKSITTEVMWRNDKKTRLQTYVVSEG